MGKPLRKKDRRDYKQSHLRDDGQPYCSLCCGSLCIKALALKLIALLSPQEKQCLYKPRLLCTDAAYAPFTASVS